MMKSKKDKKMEKRRMVRRVVLIVVSLGLLSVTVLCRVPSDLLKKKSVDVHKVVDSNSSGGGSNQPTTPTVPSPTPGDPVNPPGTGDRNRQGDWESVSQYTGDVRLLRFRPDDTMKYKMCDASGNTLAGSYEGIKVTVSGGPDNFGWVDPTSGNIYTGMWQQDGQSFLTTAGYRYVRSTQWNFCP